MIGYGLSAKPDRAYSVDLQADVAQAFVADAGVSTLALLTHDLGDTVGGELLARQAEGRWPVEITRRVLTNGSIYIEMAHLSVGQQLLLSLPDERLPETAGIDRRHHAGQPGGDVLAAIARRRVRPGRGSGSSSPTTTGHLLLPRTIRYIEERRRNEARFTGAIESHPSPLTIVWGTDDPIAVAPMATRLHAVAARRRRSPGSHDIGHYPMLEAPAAFLDAVVPALLVNSARVRQALGRAGIAPHGPHRGTTGQDDLAGDLEAVAAVEGDVAVLGGLEIGADAVAVAALEDGGQERRADALALMDGIGAEDGQIPVRRAGVAALDRGHHAQGARDVEAEGADHLGRSPQDLSEPAAASGPADPTAPRPTGRCRCSTRRGAGAAR